MLYLAPWLLPSERRPQSLRDVRDDEAKTLEFLRVFLGFGF